jgi:Fe-S cluster biogenesis protein NfuA
MTVDAMRERELEQTLADLNLALRTHGGAVECTGVEEGTVRLRMTGLCAACLFKPVTLAATIRPYIRERLGMGAEIEGARISAEAQERLERALARSYESPGVPPRWAGPRRR